MKKKYLKIFILFLIVGIILPVIPANAKAFELVPECAKSGDGGFCCGLKMAENFVKFLLGISGSIALLLFVYAGFLWITSAGKAESIGRGKKIMGQTVIGMGVIVAAWFAVNLIITSLAGNPKIMGGQNWYAICEGYDACEEKYPGWECQHYSNCGLKSYKDCEGASKCERFLCPGDNNNVCCEAVDK